MAYNILVFGAPGNVVGDSNNTANAFVQRGPNGETMQSAVIAGNSIPSSVPAGAICFINTGSSFQGYQTLTSTTTTANTLTASSPRLNYVDGTTAAFPVVLPLASTSDMLEFEFYKLDGVNNVTITAAGSDTIQFGSTTGGTVVMSTKGGKLTVRRGPSGVWRAN